MLLIERTVWTVRNNKKKGSWEQATVWLMLFRCDYAGTKIIIFIIKFVSVLRVVYDLECFWNQVTIVQNIS